jgi:hypothetical protein
MPELIPQYNLFLASPGDVSKEREIVKKVVDRINTIHVGKYRIILKAWEEYFTPNIGRIQDNIFRDTNFSSADIFVGIFWSRCGTPSGAINPETDKEYEGGSIEEVEKVLQMAKEKKMSFERLLLYYCERKIPPEKENPCQAEKLKEYFIHLEKEHRASINRYKTLENFEKIIWRDIEFVVERIKPIKKPHIGPFTSLLCNRLEHVGKFEKHFFKEYEQNPYKPQFYFIWGQKSLGHQALIERLRYQVIKKFAEEKFGVFEYSDSKVVDVHWPLGATLVERKGQICRNLIHSIDDYPKVDTYDANTALRLLSDKKSKMVVIVHHISLSCWDRVYHKLLLWYIKNYWASVPSTTNIPQILIFFSLNYENAVWWKRFAQSLCGKTPSRIFRKLRALEQQIRNECPCCFLELRPIMIGDIEEWLRNHFTDRENEQESLIKEHFLKGKSRNSTFTMNEVVEKFDKILQPYRNEGN